MWHILLTDLIPIFFVMLLGYAGGKRDVFTEEHSRAFNKLVLNYALPAALFLSIIKADRATLFADMTLSIVTLVMLLLNFFFCYFSARKLFKHENNEAAVCALIAGSPTVGFLGFALLGPLYGSDTSTGLVVAIMAIVVNAITIPIGLYMLNAKSGTNSEHSSSALLNALKEPVVWSPILAVILVLLDIKFPTILEPMFEMIAKANAGVAVFAAGLTLSAHKFQLDGEVIYNTICKLILMPASILIVGLAAGIEADKLQMLVLLGALPPAFSGIIIASRFQTYVRTGTSSLAISTLLFAITAPFWLFVSRYFTG